MWKKILLALLIKFSFLYPVVAYGGSYVRFGNGIYNSVPSRQLSFGYVDEWFGPFIKQMEVGAYIDTSNRVDRSSSGFGNIAFGIEVNTEPLVLRSMFGVSAITTPDKMLGGWFQFNEDVFAGIRDRRGNMIGINFKHMSSAGIYRDNVGRDFLTLHVEIPW